ncbi:MAG: sulfite exporter TauE/SafE family protein, partial [Pseudomonadota bacterium]
MSYDPLFWVIAVISVLITGVSKGGFGGLALLAVPMMALVISPVQAAGIMLPILIIMDWVGVWTYRKYWDRTLLLLTLPGAVLGIVAGGLLAGYVDDQVVRIVVGLIAVLFPIYAITKPSGGDAVI